MKKFFVFILSLISGIVVGQDTPKDTPTEFRFNSMTDHLTFEETEMFGKLNTSIPLYNITLQNFNLPIELKYNQDGNVRHNVVGGQFGDAWDLNVIGTVTRRTRELEPTEENLILHLNGSQAPEIPAKKQIYSTVITDEMYYRDNNISFERNDIERNVFLFNVMGTSGKFFIKKGINGLLEAVVIESSDFCKINISTDQFKQIISFELIDKSGFRYILDIKSNINENISYTSISAPALGGIVNGVGRYYESNYDNYQYQLNPAANDPSNLDGVIVYAKVNDGEDYWENMNISKIYDKDNNLLVSLEYESSPLFWIDGEFAFTYMSGYRKSYETIIKEININNRGKVLFQNTTNFSGTKLRTNNIFVKDLSNNLIKSIDFSYEKLDKKINTIDFSKILLKHVTEFSNTNNPLVTEFFYKNNVYAPFNVFDIQKDLGYVTKGYYMYGYLNSESFAADMFSLQKIKFPTGGSVLYKFGPNTSNNLYFYDSTATVDHSKYNLDNQNFTNLNLSNSGSNSNHYYFTVNDNDLVFILTNMSFSLYKIENGQSIHIYNPFGFKEKYDFTSGIKRAITQFDNPYEWYLKQQLASGEYKIVTNSSISPIVKAMKYKPVNEHKKYFYIEGMRIEEIAYFKENVNQNVLESGNTLDAEKFTRFIYSDVESNSSSGRVFNRYIQWKPLYYDSHILYGRVSVNNRGIGEKTDIYSLIPNERPSHKKIMKTIIYDHSGSLLDETVYNRLTQSYTPINYIEHMNMIVEPYDTQVKNNNKTYEGTNYIETSSETNYNSNNRQIASKIATDPLGKIVKTEFDYQTKGNKIVNTNIRNYINNNLTDQIQNSYDWLGNPTEVKFKTPEMSAYEQIGATNYHYHNGLLQGYTQLDGTPVTFIYGYNETQLVAKMVNVNAVDYYTSAAYGGIRSNIEIQSNQNHLGYNEAHLKTTLNSLRTTFLNALITTYIYKPMIGISSITDENGKETTYEYDTYNRLKTVKDYLGNILKEYEYNFTN